MIRNMCSTMFWILRVLYSSWLLDSCVWSNNLFLHELTLTAHVLETVDFYILDTVLMKWLFSFIYLNTTGELLFSLLLLSTVSNMFSSVYPSSTAVSVVQLRIRQRGNRKWDRAFCFYEVVAGLPEVVWDSEETNSKSRNKRRFK